MNSQKQFLLFLFLIGLCSESFSQRGKDGPLTVNAAGIIVNEYTAVTADALTGSTSITVAASGLNANGRFASTLSAGDLIMIIQMQGATLSGGSLEVPAGSGIFVGVPSDNTLGSVVSYNNCGNYEFCQVNSVPNGTTITIDCGLIHDYTAAGRVQIVRVPRFSSLIVNSGGLIIGTAWSGAYVGGVIAIEVEYNTTIFVNGDISAASLGFRGGGLAPLNPASFGGTQYAGTSFTVGSNKGEGIGGYGADYNSIGGQYGRGAFANGGGGGDCRNAGGGGGSNASAIPFWDGQGNPSITGGAAWVSAWDLESAGFSAHTSAGGGRGGYSYSLSNQDATIVGPNNVLWGGDNRRQSGGLGGRALDYSTGKIFLGGGGGSGDRSTGAPGSGKPGGGLIYLMNYGTISGAGGVVSPGGATLNAGLNGGAGGGGGGTIVLNSVGTISGITATATGGPGGTQFQFPILNEADGPGGGGGGGYIATSNGAITQFATGGQNGTTNSGALTEFIPNGATKGANGLTNQLITHDTITVTDVTICNGNTATLTASIDGPIGATIYWYNTIIGNAPIATGPTFTTPPLTATTTYYAGFCPGTYRKPVIVNIIGATIIPAPITGTNPICPNATGVVYSLPNVGGITYAWTVPAGATITSGQGSNQITVDFGATAGTISVIQSNICRSDPAINFAVTVTPLPVPTAIAGITPVCPNTTGVVYSVANVALSTYNWTVPAGATITAGQGTNQITVTFGGIGGNVSVVQSNPCGVAPIVNFAVAIFPLPVTSAIAGPTPVCPNQGGLIYSVTNVAGDSYNWAIPAGATITAGQGTNQITVNWGVANGTVSVVQTNVCGPGAAVNFAVVVTQLPITSVITGTTPVCPTATGIIYSVTNVIGDTYAWTVPAGATMTAGQGTNQITVTFAGTGGNVSVTESNICGPGATVNFVVAIFPLPVTSAITGPTPVCPNQAGLIYSVTNVAGDSYNWAIPAGATITAGQGTNQITVNWGVANGTVSVVQTNVCGPGAAVNFAVVVTQLPVTSVITGTTPVCPTATGIIYSVTNVIGDTYAWTVPAGATITAGQGTNQITVTFAGTGGNVSVTESNICGPGATVNFVVAIFPLPVTSAITGPTPVCPNQAGLIYSVTNVVGDTYNWTVPAGATITAGQGTNQITVNWGVANGTVSVVQTNVCGPGAAVNFAVAVTPLPLTPAITGTTPVCPNTTGVIYSVTNVAGDTYNWTVPAVATITAGQGTNQITVDFGAIGGTISVVETNICGPGPAVNFAVVVTPIPVTSAILGPSPVCLNAPGIVYLVTNVAGSTYNWSVTGGATIASGQGTNQIAINWGAVGGTISVIESNVCGSGAAVNLPVAITLLPVTSAITGTTPVCPNSTGVVFSVINTTGSSYAWTVPAGAVITAGQGTNQINVDFGVTAGNVSVTETGTCGVGATVDFAVAIFPLPATSAITGTTPVCPNITGVIYSVTNTAGNTYAWTVPAGATITAGQGTNQITVDWGVTGGNVSVIETNNCGPGTAVNFAVAISPLPVTSVITGITPVCLNATGIIYSVTNVIGDTYNWIVPAGATITAGQGTNQITVDFGVTGGTISVIETNNCGPGAVVNFAVGVTTLPVTSVITGITPVCPNTTGVIYSVTNTVGSTYNWTVPAGATITAGQGTNQITIDWGVTGGNVSVIETNNCGPGAAVNFAVGISPLPITSAITGTSPVCPNAAGVIYSVTNTLGNTYAWTVPAGATITAGQGTNQITVDFGATAGTISVIETNNCGPGTVVNFAVALFPLPATSAITGTTPVCPNTTGVIYSVTNTAGNTYAWIVPAGATITVGQGTNQITVAFGVTAGNVSVIETNNCGPGAAVNFAVAISPLPVTSVITGITSVCLNATGIIYSVTNVIGDTYNWTVPAGATITAGQGTNQITVDFGVTGGTISVIETNNCGPGAVVNFAVGVTTLPVTSAITGTTPVCPNTTGVIYSVTNTVGSTYNWTVPAGATITTGQGTNQITVDFGAAGGGNITVIETGTCGAGVAVTYNVIISSPPLPVVVSPLTYCQNVISPALTATGVNLLWYTAAAGGIGSATAPTPSTSVAGTTDYYVSQTIAGCESPRADIAVIIIPLPIVTVTSPVICNGATATMTASGATSYTWSAGATSTGITTATASPATTVSYTVTGTANGCSSTAVSTITVNNPPNIAVNSPAICTGQSAIVTATGNSSSYSWTTGATSASISVSPATTTTYTVTGSLLGCTSSAISTVTVNPIPVVSVNSETVCNGTPAVLTATGAAAYLWNTGSASNSITVTPNTTTTYTVTGTTTNCSGNATGTVTVNVVPVANFTAPFTTLITYPVVDFTNLSTNATIWNWNFGDINTANNSSTLQNPTHEYSQVGNYCVMLTASNANCADTVVHCISIEGIFTFYIPAAFSPNGDGVNDEFYGVGENISAYQISIFDRWGNMLFQGDDLKSHWNGTYMGKPVQEDVYVYVVNLKDNHNQEHKYTGSVTVVK